MGAHNGEEHPLFDRQVQMHILKRGQGAHYLIELSLSILAYEMDITP